MKKTGWHLSNSNMFGENRAKFGIQPDKVRVKAVNSVPAEKYANKVIRDIRNGAIKFGKIDPDTTYFGVLEMINNGEL